MRTVTLIQARTSSSRLPRKALLPVAGYPSAVLAALRAANRHHETILATSDDSTDHELTRKAEEHGIGVFRGPLDDVLGRFYLASSDFPEDTVLVRLTADNVVPDGEFVGELVQAFTSAGTEYVGTDSLATGLPYGLGAEAFSITALRRAHREATIAADREHVTPWIRRNCTTTVHRPRGLDHTDLDQSDFSHLRSTIDDEEDYERILRLFEGLAHPVHVPWRDLLRKLVSLPGEAAFRVPYSVVAGRARSVFTLGTAQLGMEYGAVNDHGKPSVPQAISLVRTAIARGVTAIDTARGYGSAEDVLGTALSGAWASRVEVITKLDLVGLPLDAPADEVRARVDQSVRLSCEALHASRLAVLLLHRWQDHDSWDGVAWQRLLELREAGRIGALGASVYQPSEALEALEDPAIEHLQIPMNVLDWRWEAAGVDRALKGRPEVIVHARSALLQGILAHPASRWPSVDGFDAFQCLEMLTRFTAGFGRESVTDLCLAYVRSLSWVTSVVVGCETMNQLEQNLRLTRTSKLSAEQCERLRQELPRAAEELLNPAKWKKAHEHSASQ